MTTERTDEAEVDFWNRQAKHYSNWYHVEAVPVALYKYDSGRLFLYEVPTVS
jgi:hypothetical protein